MTVVQDKRIAELEAQIAERDQRIATLEDRVAAQPSGGTVRVTEITPRVDLPTAAEMTRLYAVVVAKWPRLAHAQPERGLTLFASAFGYMSSAVSHAERRSLLSAGSWVDAAEMWLRARHRPSDMSYAAIAAASVALGFGYSGFDQPAFSWNLRASEGSHRLPGSASWRGILAGQPLRQPMLDDRPRAAERPPVIIRCGSGEGQRYETW